MKTIFSGLLGLPVLPSLAILTAVGFLGGCTILSAPSIDHTQPLTHSQTGAIKKDPATISLLKNKSQSISHYTVIGEAVVSLYNIAGIKRQKAVIHDRLRELAASMGGDAIIQLKKSDQYVSGTVIVSNPKNRA